METSTFKIGNHLHTCVASYVDVASGHLFMFVEPINHGFKVTGGNSHRPRLGRSRRPTDAPVGLR